MQIHEILVRICIRIRFRGSLPLTNGLDSDADSDPAVFVSELQDVNKKLFFVLSFFAYYFLNTFTSFFKYKSHKEVTKQKESMFFSLFLLDDRRIRIQIRTRIRNSDQWIRMRIREAQKHMDSTDPEPQHCLVDLAGKLLVRDGNTACLQEGLGARVEPALLTQNICQSTRCTIK